MATKQSSSITIYVVMSLIAIAVLSTLLYNCSQAPCESMCLCTGQGGKICQEKDVLQDSYCNKGITEYSDLAAIQKKYGGPRWF